MIFWIEGLTRAESWTSRGGIPRPTGEGLGFRVRVLGFRVLELRILGFKV